MYRIATAALATLFFAAPAVAAGPPATTVTCGQTLTHSVRVANDLTNCTGDGLVIGADGITVDLDGHTIDGDRDETSGCASAAEPAGISNTAGHDGVTIENGTVQQFNGGVITGSDSAAMSNSRVLDLVVRDNRSDAIVIAGGEEPAQRNVVDGNAISNNPCGAGVVLAIANRNHVADNRISHDRVGAIVCCGDHNLVEDNVVSHIEHDAVIVCCGADQYNVIRHNVVRDNDESGIDVCCPDGEQHNLVTDNTVTRNAHQGILLEDANTNVVSANRVFDNGDGIGADGDDNIVIDNDVAGALGCDEFCAGIGIATANGHATLIARNHVLRTAGNGIAVAAYGPATTDTIVRDNDVRDARLEGISVTPEGGGEVSGALLDGNRVRGAGDDGIHVEIAATTITANTALLNADLGIEAVPGVIDGGGNRAWGNGNPLQCTNVFCAADEN